MRGPAASGDAALAAELDRLAGRRTRRVAVAVVDLETGARIAGLGADEHTPFEIGSVTKGLTGMLLADALERGEATLDTTVADLHPECGSRPVGSVTLRELATHTSGLPRLPRTAATWARLVAFGWFGTNPYRGLTPAAVVAAAGRQRLVRRGEERYSNLGAAVLGQALARTAGCEFPALLASRICLPLGLPETYVAARGRTAPRGRGTAGRRPAPWTLGGYAPAGGVVSTVSDLVVLVTALLEGSAPGAAAIEALDPSVEGPRSSGLFWVVDAGPDRGRTMVWHNGQTGGYSSFVALYPQAGRAVVVLADTARAADQQRIALGLADWLVSGGR